MTKLTDLKNKNSSDIELVFKEWKKYSCLPQPKSLTVAVSDYIETLLKLTTLKKVLLSISNYATIVSWNRYPVHRIDIMLKMSISKQGVSKGWGLWKFMPEQNPLEKYKPFKQQDPLENLRSKFKPVTKEYTKIVDFEAGTYYGFEIDRLIGLKERKRDVLYNIGHSIVPSWSDLWEIELVIADLFYCRKHIPINMEELIKIMSYWEKYKHIGERKHE